MSKTISGVKVGKPDVSPSRPSHTKGVHRGNAPGNLSASDGIQDHGDHATGTARRSTSLNPESRNPIDPRMPNLSPP